MTSPLMPDACLVLSSGMVTNNVQALMPRELHENSSKCATWRCLVSHCLLFISGRRRQ